MNNLTQRIIFGGTALLLAACATDPEVKPDAPIVKDESAVSFTPMWQFCQDLQSGNGKSQTTLEEFVKWDDVIFTGKAVERRLRYKKGSHFNGCWVKFKIEEVIKGHLDKEIWVKAFYADNDMGHVFSYQNCYLKPGKMYLLTGKKSSHNKFLDYDVVSVHKDVASPSRYKCSPVELLENSKSLIQQIKSILKDGKKS